MGGGSKGLCCDAYQFRCSRDRDNWSICGVNNNVGYHVHWIEPSWRVLWRALHVSMAEGACNGWMALPMAGGGQFRSSHNSELPFCYPLQ